MAQPFIYDPSKSIQQSGRETAGMVENAFKPIIEKKINDFNLVKGLYDNIETERKNLDQFNEGLINKRIDETLGSLSKSILENGKVDYKKIGEMNRSVSEIRIAKDKSRVVSEQFREKIGLLYKNADKMHDIEGTVNSMRKVLSDPNFLFSPDDAAQKLNNIYADGVDMNRLLQSRVKELAKDAAADYFDKDGNRVHVKAKLVPGFQIGINGEIVGVGDETERKRLVGQLLNDQEKGVLSRQLGSAMAFNGDVDDYISDMVGGILRSSKQAEIKRTTEQIQKDLVGIEKSKNDIINSNARTQIAAQNANINARRLGLSEKEYEQKLRDSGWSIVDGQPVYDKAKDNRGKGADDLIDRILSGRDEGPTPTPNKPKAKPGNTKKTITGF